MARSPCAVHSRLLSPHSSTVLQQSQPAQIAKDVATNPSEMTHRLSNAVWVVALTAVPAAYLLYTKRTFDAKSVVSWHIHTGLNLKDEPPLHRTYDQSILEQSIPPEVLQSPGEWVVAHERVVSRPVAIADLNPGLVTTGRDGGPAAAGLEGLIEVYMATTMQLFTHTPQAWIMQRVIKDPQAKKTFDARYLKTCRFEVGDRVCGVYVVTSRTCLGPNSSPPGSEGELVILSLSPPPAWTGPAVQGNLIVGYEQVDGGIRLVNQALLWRRKGERPVFLEGALGRWMHGLMVQWMMLKGIGVLTECRMEVGSAS